NARSCGRPGCLSAVPCLDLRPCPAEARMSQAFDPAGIDPFVSALIRRQARQLVGRAGFHEQEREDIEQELFVRLWQRRLVIDPSRGLSHALLTTVVNNAIADLLRRRRAARRAGRPWSLEALVRTDEGSTSLAELVGQRHYDARRRFMPL